MRQAKLRILRVVAAGRRKNKASLTEVRNIAGCCCGTKKKQSISDRSPEYRGLLLRDEEKAKPL